jgi:hypothetical protein
MSADGRADPGSATGVTGKPSARSDRGVSSLVECPRGEACRNACKWEGDKVEY